jgi:hypothetical protein
MAAVAAAKTPANTVTAANKVKTDTCASSVRIGILMMNSPKIAQYGHHAALLNYMYAAKHGYGFMVTRCPDVQDMKHDWAWDGKNEYLLVWSKARALEHALRVFDVVLFLDSDAVVWDTDVTIESKVAALMPDAATCLVMARDCSSTTHCWHGDADKVNAGVILARRSARTSEILRRWMRPEQECKDWLYTHPREQECINILRARYYGDAIRNVPVAEMNGNDGTWVRHYMSTSSEERGRIMADLLAQRGLRIEKGGKEGFVGFVGWGPPPPALPRVLLLALVAAAAWVAWRWRWRR